MDFIIPLLVGFFLCIKCDLKTGLDQKWDLLITRYSSADFFSVLKMIVISYLFFFFFTKNKIFLYILHEQIFILV